MTYNQNVKKMIEEYLHFYLIKIIFAFFFNRDICILEWAWNIPKYQFKKKKFYNKKEEGKKK